ncbi:MAG: choice-of-anchor D domain-containing protein, partial [Bacteroidales bacterium]|nr:choice-of-anchor D domain-containing protein [Bacteroidales bacterium]
GDYDNDGDLDIILSGYNGSPFTQIYRNDGTGFTALNLAYLENLAGSVSWGDYDNDGDLDILQTGWDDLGDNKIKLYSNNSDTPNQPAAAPDNLSFSVTETDVTLTWDKATDTETPQDGLSYNLFLYKEDPVKSKSKTLVRKIENIQYNSSGITLSNLSDGNYSWSIQAFDTGLKEGEISIEQNFSIGGPEINIQGNSSDIPDNQSTTSSNDFTDFENVKYDEDLVRSFTIKNTGTTDLILKTATVTGIGFSITQPILTVLTSDETTSFTVTFVPESTGVINGNINIPNNDNDENPYNFAITGTGIKGDPVISWSDPADITYGTALSETQLNALTEITGSFVYTPDIGTILEVGADQSLEAEFTPTDETNYNKASKTVYITVNETTGIEERIEKSLKIFPNPNNGKFYVHYETKGNELIKLQLIDLSGKIILNEQLTASDLNNYQIQIPNADKGTYILRLSVNEKEIKQKIVIQ